MKVSAAAVALAAFGLAACSTPAATTIVLTQSPAQETAGVGHPATTAVASAKPAPTMTKTVIKYSSAPATQAPRSSAAQTPGGSAPAAAPQPVPNVTDPWAVVSAYYGDIESGDYAEAWALLNSGMTTGQTYQQFVDGFACTGAQDLSENWQSGDEVNFNLAATDDCTGAVQYFTGTDTVVGGKIVAANVARTG